IREILSELRQRDRGRPTVGPRSSSDARGAPRAARRAAAVGRPTDASRRRATADRARPAPAARARVDPFVLLQLVEVEEERTRREQRNQRYRDWQPPAPTRKPARKHPNRLARARAAPLH